MFDGFKPELQSWFFERRVAPSALSIAMLLGSGAMWLYMQETAEKTVEVELADPELSDFSLEDDEDDEFEEEAQEEPEQEALPPPPPDAKVKVVKQVTPKPQNVTPDAMPDEVAAETDVEKSYEVLESGKTSKTGFGGGSGTKPAQARKPSKPTSPSAKKSAKPKKTRAPIDPTKPVDRPENATVPKPLPSNAQPQYPKALRDRGITGRVVVKLHVHRDGTVRGAKILAKKTSATTKEEQSKAAQLFVTAIKRVIPRWKFKPATLEGKPISVWHKVTIPFELTN